MKLYILRHGEAGFGAPDSQRKLTAVGEQEVLAVGRLLRRRQVRFDAIISSDLARAIQTAEIVANELNAVDRIRPEPILGHGCSLDDVRTVLRDLASDATVLLVGHEPNWSRLISDLTGGAVRMATGGLARVDAFALRPGAGELRWLAPPAVLTGE